MSLARTSTDPKELNRLSRRDVNTRCEVAENKYTSVTTLDKLANDRDDFVRYEVAKNHNTSITALLTLINDKDKTVASAAKKNLKNKDVLGDLLGEARCFESFQEWRKSN